jgi:hypothetical protein
MMNIKSYDHAVVAFETVLYINPRLQQDEAIIRNLRYCKQNEWTGSRRVKGSGEGDSASSSCS